MDYEISELKNKIEEKKYDENFDYESWKEQEAKRESVYSEDREINEMFNSYE